MRTITRLLLLLALTAVSMGAAATSAAAAPWWHLSLGTRPANIQPGAAANDVQRVKVIASSGSYELVTNLAGERSAEFTVGEDAAEFQAALESAIGAGTVTVTASPGPNNSNETYEIAFGGSLTHRFIPTFAARSLLLSGGSQRLLVNHAIEGRTDGELAVTLTNMGESAVAATPGSPVQITDELPPGLTAVSARGFAPVENGAGVFPCLVESPSRVTCTFAGESEESTLNVPGLSPSSSLMVRIPVEASGVAQGALNTVSVSGADAPPVRVSRALWIDPAATPFGIEAYELNPEEPAGQPATQAGSHPFQTTFTVTANQLFDKGPGAHSRPLDLPADHVKDVRVNLPPGMVGNPTAVPTCPTLDFGRFAPGGGGNECKANTAVGVATVSVNVGDPNAGSNGALGYAQARVPVFNIDPQAGQPARFGFFLPIAGFGVLIDPSLRSNGDYGITATTSNVTLLASLLSAEVTLWGVPGDSRHDAVRGWGCLESSHGKPPQTPCEHSEINHPLAFFTLPTSCSQPMQSSVDADSWLHPGEFVHTSAEPAPPALDGCDRVPFAPKIKAEPTAEAATSPTGLSFDIDIGDEGLLNGSGIAESQLKKAVVTLPVGFTTNPSVAEGLHACTLAQYEAETVDSQLGVGCPNESKIGDVEIQSPLVKQTVLGSLYVAQQGQNPNGNLLTLYLVAKNPEIGVIVKQALKVTPDPVTGQLSTEVDNIPQLPFSHFHLSFRQGQRSPLVTPPACGTYSVKAALYPYSDPEVARNVESSFQITQGPEGQPCPSGATPPFHPNLEAGSINPAAGTYSPFYTHLSRKDSEQEITHFSIKLPPGVSGKLAGIPECSDAGIAAAKAREHEGGGTEEEQSPSCPLASEVGHSLVGSGVGNVLAYAPGKLYLAGPYHGSNLSLVSITAAKVGPFDLGTVVVRFALKIDPETAEVSVDGATSDPIPHIVDGIPVHLRDIRAYVDKPQFVLNPTSCKKTSTASTVLGSGLNFASEADDVPVTVTSPFQAADCASLGFAPQLALSLKGGTKRGATPAFKAVLTYPKGSYANIASSQVTLPHSEFLEQSHIGTVCTRTQFKEGKIPGEKCPAASVYGRARAVTPILSEPLEGPVYLRSSSHNLPDLVAALHNRQVDIALDGRIDSVQNGRIRNTFESVPDAPVSKFVLEMQGGKKGLLVNSTDICRTKHKAISHFVGQNGKVYDTNPVLQAKCGGKAKKAHKKGSK